MKPLSIIMQNPILEGKKKLFEVNDTLVILHYRFCLQTELTSRMSLEHPRGWGDCTVGWWQVERLWNCVY